MRDSNLIPNKQRGSSILSEITVFVLYSKVKSIQLGSDATGSNKGSWRDQVTQVIHISYHVML